MKPVQTLPIDYHEAGTIDLSKNRRLLMIMNLAGLVLLLVFGWLFFQAVIVLRLNILTPLVIITLAGLASLPVIPPGWVLQVWNVLNLNTVGVIGDMLVTIWILTRPSPVLVQDRRDAVTLYLNDR